jgi:DnaJ like chaperone protein
MIVLIEVFVLIILLFFIRAIVKFYKSQKFYRIKEDEPTLGLLKSEDKKATAYIFLAAWLLKKNARYSEVKIAFIHSYIKRNFDKSTVDVTFELTQALRKTTTIRAIARWVVQQLTSEKERLKLLDFLLDVSFSEERIIDREIVAITRFGSLIGISYSFISREIDKRIASFNTDKQATRNYFSNDINNSKAFKILQIDENASLKEIKRAYRKLAAKYHPDKFVLASAEKQQEMTTAFLEINSAYNYLVN